MRSGFRAKPLALSVRPLVLRARPLVLGLDYIQGINKDEKTQKELKKNPLAIPDTWPNGPQDRFPEVATRRRARIPSAKVKGRSASGACGTGEKKTQAK